MNETEDPYLPMVSYINYPDPTGGTIEYYNDRNGVLKSYRKMTSSKSIIMPVGDFRKFFQFDREMTPFPVEIWFPMDMRTEANRAWEIRPEIEKKGRVGGLAYHYNEVTSISLGNFFCFSGREWIAQLKEPILEIHHGRTEIGLICLFLQDHELDLVVKQENTDPREMTFYHIVNREGEVVSRVSWEQSHGFFIARQTYYPNTEREITKTLRAPIKIDREKAEEIAFPLLI